MQQVALGDVIARAQELLKAGRPQDALGMIVPALSQFPDNPALWFFHGYACHATGQKAIAVSSWARSFDLEPQAQVLANLGAAMRASSDPEGARVVLEKALRLNPDDRPTLANLTGSYVNEGMPEQGIAVAAGREDWPQLQFNLALLNLEAGHFATGFRLYATGHHESRQRRTYEGARPLTAQDFEDARGHRLVVYGEQGIGDELMFATMLGDVLKDFDVTFDCHPRLETLHRTLPWAKRLNLHATRKSAADWFKPGDAAYCAPIADLAQFYRDAPEKFRWEGPYYRPPAEEVEVTRRYLGELAGGRKIIGLSLRGGSLETARTYRTIDPALLDALFRREDVVLVALDYDDITDIAQWVAETYGPGKLVWIPSITWAWDYHHKAALVACTDAVLTVCQSVAHLSAAMGHPTHVLTPSRCAWRYGVRPGLRTPWYWYPCSHAWLHRQQGNDWTPAIEDALQCLP